MELKIAIPFWKRGRGSKSKRSIIDGTVQKYIFGQCKIHDLKLKLVKE